MNHSDLATGVAPAPWLQPGLFGAAPSGFEYGYVKDRVWNPCSRDQLLARVRGNTSGDIPLVWTPASPHLVMPEEVPWLREATSGRDRDKVHGVLDNARIGVVIALLWAVVSWLGEGEIPWVIVVALGVLPLLEAGWEMYQRSRGVETSRPERAADTRYRLWVGTQRAPWTRVIAACITGVGLAQVVIGLYAGDPGFLAAGLVKDAARAGEWWRLLTGAFLHANLLHFIFNVAVLLSLGKPLEVTFRGAYVPMVFVLAVVAGGLASMLALPEGISVGASGGIMGMLGLALVLAWSSGSAFPRSVRRSWLLGVIYTLVIGLVGYEFIDNAAHVGGLCAGAGLGVILTRLEPAPIKPPPSKLVNALGAVSLAVIVGAAIWCDVRIVALLF